jgi:hypothetical protein
MAVASSEEWRDVLGYEGVYHVSNHGQVKRVLQSRGTRPGLLKPTVHPRNGYRTVMLWNQNRSQRFTVHRLVALAFLGQPDEGLEVCHRDDNPSNNHVSNLRWDTHSENHLDITRNGNRPTVCRNGHQYTKDNIQMVGEQRRCKTCYRAEQLRRNAVRRANREATK